MNWFKCTDPFKSNIMDSVKANTLKLYALEEECTGYIYATYPRQVIVTIASQNRQFIAYNNDSQGSRELLNKIPTMNCAFTFLTHSNINNIQANCLSQGGLMAHRTWSPIPKVGLTVYLLGYSTHSTNLTITKGTLTDTTSFDSWFVTISSHISSNADSIGWSGGPVVNKQGQLVGIIEQTCGDWVKIVPAHYLYTVATLIADSKST